MPLEKNLTELAKEHLDLPLPGTCTLKLWSEMPTWRQHDCKYIMTGYRSTSGSYVESFKSWRYLHNETVNIFSHLIGSALFFVLPIVLYQELKPRYETASSADIIVLLAYLLGVALCFAFSAVYHTIVNHSEEVCALGLQLDFQGILLLMWGANIPVIYYGFICAPTLRIVYWTLTSSLALTCSAFTFSPTFRSGAAYLRLTLFGGFALSAVVPIVHSIMLYGWEAQNNRISLWYILALLAFNTTGAVAYGLKFPERFFPKRFDIFGSSHQIMHVMVLCASIVHMVGLVRDFDNLHSRPLSCVGL